MAATATDLTVCGRCGGSGWRDPWDDGGSPELVACHWCLGAGTDDCPACDGEGSVADPAPCACDAD